MSRVRTLLKGHVRHIVLAAFAAALFALWFGLWLRVLPLKPRLEWRIPEEAYPIQVSQNGQVAVTVGLFLSSGEGQVEVSIWDLTTGRLLSRLLKGDQEFSGLTLSPDGTRIACAYVNSGGKGGASCYDTRTGREVVRLPGFGATFRFSPDSRYLAASSCEAASDQDARIRLLSAKTGEPLMTFPAPGGVIHYSDCWFSPDSRMIAIHCNEQNEDQLQLWDLASRSCVLRIPGGFPPVAFSPDASLIACGGSDSGASSQRPVRVFHLATGLEKWALGGHQGDVAALIFRRDGNGLVALECRSDGMNTFLNCITAWDLRSEQVSSQYERQQGQTLMSPGWREPPKDRFIWMAGFDSMLLDLTDGSKVFKLDSSVDGLMSVSPDAQYLAYAALEKPRQIDALRWLRPSSSPEYDECGPMIMLELASGRKIAYFNDNASYWTFTESGESLVVQTWDGRIQVWDLPPRRPIFLLLALSAVPTLLFTGVLWWRWGRGYN